MIVKLESNCVKSINGRININNEDGEEIRYIYFACKRGQRLVGATIGNSIGKTVGEGLV